MLRYPNERQNRCDREEPNIWGAQIRIHDVSPLRVRLTIRSDSLS
jgi:hypothetical protein